tara:strand:- start:247 stop:408 length:162 start_codon:yes stop_codon:yes gene_type:complete
MRVSYQQYLHYLHLELLDLPVRLDQEDPAGPQDLLYRPEYQNQIQLRLMYQYL